MEFRVHFEDGLWIFRVSSTDEEISYHEEFEATSLEEAVEAAAELLEEISLPEEDFQEDFLEELDARDVH